MTLDEIKMLIEAMGASDLAEMEVARGGWSLRLVRHAQLVSSTVSAAPSSEARPAVVDASAPPARPRPGTPKKPTARPEVRAPLAGIAYVSPSPEAPAFVNVGQAVEAGAILCTVEAMKTFNEVRADRAGVIEAVLVVSGDEVDAGQPLFRMA